MYICTNVEMKYGPFENCVQCLYEPKKITKSEQHLQLLKYANETSLKGQQNIGQTLQLCTFMHYWSDFQLSVRETGYLIF